MTAAWFLVPITGDGKSTNTPFAATITSEVVSHVAVIATNASGTPAFSWSLLQAQGSSFPILTSISGVFAMPTPTLSLFNTLNASQQLAVTQALTHYSIAVSPTAVQKLSEVITNIGKVQEPAFDLANFYVIPPRALP